MRPMAVKLKTGLRTALLRASRVASSALDGFTIIGDMPSLPASGSSAHVALLADVEEIIAEGPNRRRFSKLIEVIYAEATRQARNKFFIVMAVVGVTFYDAFLFADLLIIRDHVWLLSILQLGVVTPLSIAMVMLALRGKLDRDVASVIVLTAMLAATLLGLRLVDNSYAMLFACAPILVITSSNLFVAMPLSWSVVFTALTNVAIAAVLLTHPVIETNAAFFVMTLMLAASLYSIGGHYRIDAGVRGAFLFTLRERMRSDQLAVSNRRLNALADIDGLTGIGNRRAFDRIIGNLCGRSRVGLVLIDIDHFKLLNDRHGHLVGDACLRQVASLLVDRMPDARHFPARYGGEEFTVIIKDGDAKSTFAIAEHLRVAVGDAVLVEDEAGEVIRATVSIGCAYLPAGTMASPVDLIAAADQALYDAKRSGRNRTRMAQVDGPTPDTAAAPATVRDAA